MKFKSINPYTEEVNWTYDSFPIGDTVRSQIEKSRYAFLSWNSLSYARKKGVEPIRGKPKKDSSSIRQLSLQPVRIWMYAKGWSSDPLHL